MFGVASLNMCYVAAGRCQSFVERSLKSWDICAGTIIVREAGGVVEDCADSAHFDLHKGECIAAASHELARDMCKLLK